MFFVQLVAALIPSAFLMWWFHRRDANPEPRSVLWKTGALGVLSAIPVVLVVSIYARYIDAIESPLINGTLSAFLSAAIPEEFFKFLVVVLFAARLRDFDEPMDGVVYGVAASLGFATIENILYVTEGGLSVALARAFSAVPAHALFGAVMGVFVGRAKFDPGRVHVHLAAALGWPILLHGLYDAPLLAMRVALHSDRPDEFSGVWLWLVPIVMIFGWYWVRQRVGELRGAQLAEADPFPPTEPQNVLRHGGSSRWRLVARVVGWFLMGIAALLTLVFLATYFSGTVEAGERQSFLLGVAILIGLPALAGGGFLGWGKRASR